MTGFTREEARGHGLREGMVLVECDGHDLGPMDFFAVMEGLGAIPPGKPTQLRFRLPGGEAEPAEAAP